VQVDNQVARVAVLTLALRGVAEQGVKLDWSQVQLVAFLLLGRLLIGH